MGGRRSDREPSGIVALASGLAGSVYAIHGDGIAVLTDSCNDPAGSASSRSPVTWRIFTVGYEGSTQAAVVAVLSAAGVELLADVRAVPLSRRPGFSKNVLAAGLREAGIDYVSLKALGTPPEGREAARKHDRARLATIYAGQLELPEALAQMARLRASAAERRTAVLCFEREPALCHRSLLVAAALPEAEVIDLFAT